MQRKVNITKTTVLLAIAIILAVSVCFSAVYAWFYTSTDANANIDGKVLNFYFTTNGTFNENITITEGDGYLTYEKDPKTGMFPGQKMNVKLVLSNEASNVDAIYKISVKGEENDKYPPDCLLYIKNAEGEGYERWTFVPDTVIYPTESNTDKYSADGTYAFLKAGEKKELMLTVEWPLEYGDIPEGVTGIYADEDEKNSGDMNFLLSCKDAEGNITERFSLTLRISAEQVK